MVSIKNKSSFGGRTTDFVKGRVWLFHTIAGRIRWLADMRGKIMTTGRQEARKHGFP